MAACDARAAAWKRRAAAALWVAGSPWIVPACELATSLAAQAAQARAQRSISYGVNFLLAAPRRTAGIGAWNHLQKTASMLPASVLRLAAR